MRTALRGLLLVLSCLAPQAFAQGFSGHAETKGFGYLDRGSAREPWVIGWSTLLLKEELRLGRVSVHASLRAEAITSHERGPLVFDPADRELRRSPLSLREIWVRLPIANALDVQAGRFELGWGKTDGYSPADAFLPRDSSDSYANEKLPLWGVRLLGQRGPLRFELFGSLTTTPSRLPVLSGRNAPAPVTFAYFVDGTSSPPREGFGAVRLLATFGDWDVGLWGRAGVRPAPLLVFRTDQVRFEEDGVAVPVDRRFAREQAVGVELSRVVASFVVRAEFAALFSRDAELGDALIWTLGAERAFGDGTLLVTLAVNSRGTPIAPVLLLDRAFLPAVIIVWNQTESWGSWKTVLTNALRHGDGLFQAEGSYALTDVWRVTVGVDVPFGSREGPLGARPDTRRGWVGVRRSW